MIPYGDQGRAVVPGRINHRRSRHCFPKLNETLIKDWRKLWGDANLPFYICQLAALQAAATRPRYASCRRQALSLPHTGMAVTIDIGDPKNVHPKNKQDVGDRLMRIALANTYGQGDRILRAEYESMAIDGDTIRLTFTMRQGLDGEGRAS